MSSKLLQGFQLGSWKVEPLRGAVSDPNEETYHLEPKVMDVFVCLAECINETASRSYLLNCVWSGNEVSDEQLTRAIGELRRVLRNGHDASARIETVPKRGYRLIGEVRVTEGSPATRAYDNQLSVRRRNATVRAGLVVVILAVAVFALSDYFDVLQPVVANYKKISTSHVIMPPAPSPLPIIADDSRLYFTQLLNGELIFSQLAQSGGEAAPFKWLVTDSESIAGINGMTPDKSNLLIENYRGIKSGPSSPELWIVPTVGGSPQRIGKGRQGVFSPSGNRLLFMKGSINMYIANPDMTAARKIATLTNRVYWTRFSPDGTRVRFTQFLDQFASTLWELKLDGSDPYQLLQDWQAKSSCCGSWTPDGRYYIFQARTDNGTQLWAIENSDSGGIESSKPFQITSGAIDFLRPTISADGKTIFATGWQLRGEILLYDIATGSFSPVPGLESMSVEQASYSRDQHSVAYVAYPDGTLWRKKINGDDTLQLTSEPMRAAAPAWSPDGSEIAFTGWVPGERHKVYVVAASGGALRLISAGDHNSWSPSWSSDGEKLVFSHGARDQLQVFDFTLGITTNLLGTGGIRTPSWSPDGKSIAAWSGRNLVLYDVDSQESILLLENAGYEYIYWSGDSAKLYLVDSFVAGRARSVYSLNIESRRLNRIAVIGKIRNIWGTNGRWVGIGPDGKTMLLRDQSIHNIYALEWDAN